MSGSRLAPQGFEAFILENTRVLSPPHVPEIRLHLADEAHQLWLRTEAELGEIGLAPPFWAFAWAGGQALARHVLDHPEIVRGMRVLDFASGSGLVALAAAKAGAAEVLAVDVDPFCRTAIGLNARLNGACLACAIGDPVGQPVEADIVLAGDVFFDAGLAGAIIPWFDGLVAAGTRVLVGDPGRTYLPRARLERLATYEVAVTRALEDAEVKRTTVWAWRGGRQGGPPCGGAPAGEPT